MRTLRFPGALLALCSAALPALAQDVAASSPSSPAGSASMPSGCAGREGALPEGPVFAAYHEVDFATGRRACPRTELGLGGRGAAIIDTPNFYGALSADALLFGSWAVSDRTELFATVELVHWTFAQNATLKGTTLGLGQTSVGASRVVVSQDRLTVTPSARLMLPTATGEAGVHLMGVEGGAAVALRPLASLEVHGFAGADVGFGVFSPAPSQPRLGALLLAGVQYSPWRWLGVALDLDVHLGHRAALDYLAPALALRFGIGNALGVDLSATLPIAGADRHDFAGALRLTWRMGS